MKKTILSLTIATASAIGSYGQTAHYYISSPNRNEVARSVKVLDDGSSIIAGYIYDLDGAKNMINADNLLLRVDPSGNIMWQQQWGTQRNDFLYEMILTQNNEIVLVGTANSFSTYINNTAAIYRFDINGNKLNESFVREYNYNTGGEVFTGVCETKSGDIVAVGAHNFAPANANAFLSFFDANLNHQYSETVPLNTSQSDIFTNVVADTDSDRVYILGYMYRPSAPAATTYYDQVLLKFNPYAGTSGAINWMRYSDISYLAGGMEPNILTNNYPTKVFVQNNKLLVSGITADGWNGAGGDRHYLFRCDKLSGNTPELRIVNNGSGPAQHANTSMMAPLSADEMFISNVSGNQYDYNKPGPFGMNGWISHVSSFNTSTTPTSTYFKLNGNESIQSLEIGNTSGALNGYLFMAGNANPTTNGLNDIYYGIVAPSLTDSTAICPIDTITSLDSIGAVANPYWVGLDTFRLAEQLQTRDTTVMLVSNMVCGNTLHNKQGTTTNISSTDKTIATMTISPNPSAGQFNVFYGIPYSFSEAKMIVTDITGKILYTKTLKANSAIEPVSLNMPGSIVLCTLVVDGEITTTQKVVINK